MKNLQKVLALGLALIMLMGMFTVASAAEAKVATDLTDWNSISHQNAVALNVDLGIIKGMPDGSYKPTDLIDRASWAKLAYVAACGDEDADAYLGTSTVLKDIAGNWAESYISYLAANSYISGDTAGNYNPSNNVTVVEACKTMLTILGYNAKDRGYENDIAWSGKIMSDAKSNGLMDNVDKEQTALKPLTRENAAQIIYNALAAQTVEEVKTYDQGNKYVSHYNKDVPLGYKVFNLIKLEGIVNSIEKDGTVNFVSLKPVGTTGISAATGKVNKYVGGDVADVGQLCTVFVKGVASFNADNNVVSNLTVVDELISANVAPSDTDPLLTVTKGANFQSQPGMVWNVKDVENYVGVDCEVSTTTTNGVTTTVPNPSVIKYYVNGNNDQGATNAQPGDIAKLYDTDNNGKVDTIAIIKYQVAKLSGPVRTQKDASNKDTVMIPGVTAGFIPVSQVKGPYANLQQDDVVLFYTNRLTGLATSDDVVTVEIPETITGKITRVDNKGRATVNGTQYPATGIVGGTTHTATAMYNWNDFENEYTFYLDKNNGICYDVQNTDAAIAGNVAVVLESRWIAGGTIDASNYLQAKLMLADGDVVITPIDRVGVASANGVVMCNIVNTVSTADVPNKKVPYTSYNNLTPANGFWGYRVNANGHYELTNLDLRTKDYASATAVGTVASTIKVDKKPNYLLNGTAAVAGYSANNDTLFLVEKYNATTDTSTYETFTGYANVPAMNAGTVMTVASINAKNALGQVQGAAKYVYIKTGSYADDLPEGLVFRVNTDNGRDADNYTIEVLDKNGASTVLVVDSLSYVGDAREMYTIDEVSDGVVTGMTKVIANDADKGLTVGTLKGMGAGVVTSNEGKSFQYDGSTICVLIDLKVTQANGTTLSSAGIIDPASGVDMDENIYQAGTKLYVIADKEDLASYIYVVRTMVQS